MNLDFPLTKSTRTPLRSGGRSPSTPSSPCLLSGGWHSVRRLCCSPWSSCAQNLGGHGGGGGDGREWVEGKQSGREMSLTPSSESVRAAGDCSGLRSRCLSVSATGSSDCARTRPLIRFVLIIQPFFLLPTSTPWLYWKRNGEMWQYWGEVRHKDALIKPRRSRRNALKWTFID